VRSRGVLLGTAAVAVLTLAGCTGGASTGTAATASPTGSAEPPAASAAAAAGAAADPALAASPADAALALALRDGDLPAGWSVQANPLSEGAALVDNPSLAGICGASSSSEVHRTTKHPVVGLDGSGTPQVSAEAIAYDSAGAAATAVQELVRAFGGCPPDEYTFEPGPPADGLAEEVDRPPARPEHGDPRDNGDQRRQRQHRKQQVEIAQHLAELALRHHQCQAHVTPRCPARTPDTRPRAARPRPRA